jgi:membrane protein DedA with SNARE-associated domain
MKSYAQYSTLGFQMLFVILAGYFAGNYLDKRFENTNALFTVIGASLAVVISLVWIIWKLINQK